MTTRLLRTSRFGFVVLLFIFASHDAFSHRQPVHQYVAREGYSLLLQRIGHDIPALTAGIGLADPSFAGDSAWQKGCITTGAWREDDEDVVYHYDILPGLNYALTSITHFWDADQGDYTQNIFRLMVEQPYPIPPLSTDIGPFHNTYDKIMQFAHGGWVLDYPRTIFCQNTSNNHYLVITPLVSSGGFGIPLEYAGLANFYTGMKLRVRADQPSLCEVLDINALKTISLSDVSEIKVQEEVRNIVVWEILGRMCHLLGDMSIPAHAHRDEHGLNPDSYEDYVGGPGDPYKLCDHTNVGTAFALNVPSDEALHSLMYVVQQQADHFGSNGPAQGAGNDIIGGNPTQAERDFLSEVNLSSLGGPTTDAGPWTADNLNIIRDKTMPMLIRATAGLLYWFCREAGLVETVTAIPASDGAAAEPATYALMQNYPNPFNPTTRIGYVVGRVVVPSGALLSGVEGPASSKVKLAVYDLMGREVAVLVDERKAPGTYEVNFSAKGGSASGGDGSGLASGAYIYRLTAGSYTESRRMLLIR
jgi:hypothetical protein